MAGKFKLSLLCHLRYLSYYIDLIAGGGEKVGGSRQLASGLKYNSDCTHHHQRRPFFFSFSKPAANIQELITAVCIQVDSSMRFTGEKSDLDFVINHGL